MEEHDHHGPHMVELVVVCSGVVLGQQPPPPWLLAWQISVEDKVVSRYPDGKMIGCNLRVPEKLSVGCIHVDKVASNVGARVIDADYRGLVVLVLFNLSEVDFIVKPVGHVAQMIVQVDHWEMPTSLHDPDQTFGSREGIKGSCDA
ncbi:uncharacterized protein [Aegilops tauschii subsp. strangulata]|uniref:uncharacterized protein n=1 Tax=Aegilops tauschii subsp. strangulata TaxID=200361 RepID=UPI003CC840DE